MDIEDFDFPEVEAFVRAVHGMEINLSDIQTTIKLMMIADKYEVLQFRDDCEKFIKNGLNEQNAVDALIIADQLDLKDIEQQALNFMVENKLNVNIFDGKGVSSELLIKVFKTVYGKLTEKM